MAGILRISNLKKTWYYLKKNGLRSAGMAVWERIEERRQTPYVYEPPTKEELAQQAKALQQREDAPCFSVVVPAYETKKVYLTALLESMQQQSCPNWELVIADASGSSRVYESLAEWAALAHIPVLTEKDSTGDFVKSSIRYVKLAKNAGISQNTNAGIQAATGSYIGLLDHDDVLTKDALYEMSAAILAEKNAGREPEALYSDEDKCDGSGQVFYEPHCKTDFDPELLLTNNYICHFLVMRAELMRSLQLRPAYDGAQDYDLVLRALGEGVSFIHIPRVLYHWRCHQESTAANPRSKSYAYEAGRRALEDFCRQKGWRATVLDLKHLGFYRIDYENIWEDRPEIGALAWPVVRKGRLVSGIYQGTEQMRYQGLRRGFSGPMHRAVLQQEAPAADLRQLQCAPRFRAAWQEALTAAAREACMREAGSKFARLLAENGCKILWDPALLAGGGQKGAGFENNGDHSEL